MVSSNYVLAATDGSCLDPRDEDLRRAGLGVFWRAECRANMRSRLGGIVQSNQRAEAVAILVALRQAAHSSLPLMIWSDSRYCVDLMELLLPPRGESNEAIWGSWDTRMCGYSSTTASWSSPVMRMGVRCWPSSG